LVRAPGSVATLDSQAYDNWIELVRLLERHPLRGRKRREFDVWAAAVGRWAARPYGATSPGDHAAMRRASDELRRLRRYVDPGAGRESTRRRGATISCGSCAASSPVRVTCSWIA
jgi:hypothetical protein